MLPPRGPANMQSIGLAALDGSPSGDLEALKKRSKKRLNFEALLGARFALTRARAELFALVTSNYASGNRTRPQQSLSVELLLFRTRTFGPLCSLLSALFSPSCVPSSFAAAHFSDRTAHLSLRSVQQAIDFAPNCFDPLRLPPWPGGMREAIK